MSDDVGRIANETLHVNIGTILNNFSNDDKCLIRKIENLSKKEINARYAVIFNETCDKENLLPTYTNIYIYVTGQVRNQSMCTWTSPCAHGRVCSVRLSRCEYGTSNFSFDGRMTIVYLIGSLRGSVMLTSL